ncbi:MAG: hypothetical protein O7F70_01225 [Gemmatimonadetes bacterium]|nr:hypothetical protein [Gemmatimonadota bacterium]
MHWFDRPELVSQFPFPYRVLARYCRLAVHRPTGTVRGGSFLQRTIIRLSNTLRLESRAHIQLKNASAYLDLRDPRIWFVMDEVEGESSDLAFVRGARRMIAARHPVILFEMNPTSARAAGWEPRELLAELGSLGYDRACPVDEFGTWRVLEDLDTQRQQNIVTVSAERRVPAE